jgi:hypothetical protein
MIDKLTPEQEALIPVYRDKWRKIALSTERIDRQKAAKAVKAVYTSFYLNEPEILFFDSPFAAGEYVLNKIVNQLLKELSQPPQPPTNALDKLFELLEKQLAKPEQLLRKLVDKLKNPFVPPRTDSLSFELCCLLQEYLDEKLRDELRTLLWEKEELLKAKLEVYLRTKIDILKVLMKNEVSKQLETQVRNQLKNKFINIIESLFWQDVSKQLNYEIDQFVVNSLSVSDIGYKDFLITELNCDTHNLDEWLVSQSIVKDCGWIIPYENLCIVCDRPTLLHFDNENRLHAEGKPAIEFADGYSIYSYHGVTLPEKYGKIHPHAWESQWLLSENNAELRRVLIQGIGYDRIASELQARELDAWAEYTLLKIDADVDDEPIHLLKMTCPSTGFIHALRVPPDTESAREAIRWVNWGIDPEEFQQQT